MTLKILLETWKHIQKFLVQSKHSLSQLLKLLYKESIIQKLQIETFQEQQVFHLAVYPFSLQLQDSVEILLMQQTNQKTTEEMQELKWQNKRKKKNFQVRQEVQLQTVETVTPRYDNYLQIFSNYNNQNDYNYNNHHKDQNYYQDYMYRMSMRFRSKSGSAVENLQLEDVETNKSQSSI